MMELVETGVIGIVVGVVMLLRHLNAADRTREAQYTQLRADIAGLASALVTLGQIAIASEGSRVAETKETRRMILRSEPNEP